MSVSVVDRLNRELAKLPPDLADSALAGSALVMAEALDNPKASFTAKSMCQNRMQEALDRLRELAPPEEKRDDLDDIAARRALRLAGS